MSEISKAHFCPSENKHYHSNNDDIWFQTIYVLIAYFFLITSDGLTIIQ